MERSIPISFSNRPGTIPHGVWLSGPATTKSASVDECSPHLNKPIPWQEGTSGIDYGPISVTYNVTNAPAAPSRFYRLRWP